MSSERMLDGASQLVSRDPPYNIHYEKRKGHPDDEGLSEDEMDDFEKCMTSFMKKRARGHVFGSTVQFKYGFKAFTAPQEATSFVHKESGSVVTTKNPCVLGGSHLTHLHACPLFLQQRSSNGKSLHTSVT